MTQSPQIPNGSFIEDLKAGCPEAFDRLVREFEGPLYRFHYCDHGDHHAAQDQTAETFVQLVRSIRSMRGNAGHLRAFVFAVARRVQQRRRRRKRMPLPLAVETDIPDHRPLPDVVLADQEQIDHLLRAIRKLDGPVRNVLLLRFVEEYSLNEVAAALEMPLGTVKSHIHRGRAQLGEILAVKGCQT